MSYVSLFHALIHEAIAIIQQSTDDFYRIQIARAGSTENVSIFGSSRWAHFIKSQKQSFRQLTPSETFAAHQASPISVCYSSIQFPTRTSLEVFSVLAAGGFPLVNEKIDLKQLFEPNDIASFSNVEDLKDKINFFSKNSSAKIKMTNSARKKLIGEHTFSTRLSQALKSLSL